MRLVNFYPKDIYVQVELSLTELKKLVNFLDNCEVPLEKVQNEGLADSFEFVSNQLFPYLDQLVDQIEGGKNGP